MLGEPCAARRERLDRVVCDPVGVGGIAGGLAGGGVCHQLADLLDDVQEPSLADELVWGEARYAGGACRTATITCRRAESSVAREGPGLDSEIRNVAAGLQAWRRAGAASWHSACSRTYLATGASAPHSASVASPRSGIPQSGASCAAAARRDPGRNARTGRSGPRRRRTAPRGPARRSTRAQAARHRPLGAARARAVPPSERPRRQTARAGAPAVPGKAPEHRQGASDWEALRPPRGSSSGTALLERAPESGVTMSLRRHQNTCSHPLGRLWAAVTSGHHAAVPLRGGRQVKRRCAVA